MRVAIVHYWLTRMRGGEKVIEALCELYPEADLFTHVYDPRFVSETIRRHKVQSTFIQRLPFAGRRYQNYLPLMPMALEQLDLSAYDLVISSESGPAKGVIPRPDALHVCYVHSPMRYLWDQHKLYRDAAGFAQRLAMPFLWPGLRQWDVTSAARVDHFFANSTIVKKRIEKYWRRSSEILAPPVDVERFAAPPKDEGFYLSVGELTRYKRVDIAVEAATKLGRELVVIGEGPELKKLKAMAGPTVRFLGRASNEDVAAAFQNCRAFLFPAEEDFGIVAVEAMAAGKPVIAYGRGGARDSVIDGETGLFFHAQTAEALAEAILRGEARRFDAARLRAHAAQFSKTAFQQAFKARVDTLLAARA